MEPLSGKIGRGDVCESRSLIGIHLHKLVFLVFSLTVEKVLTDQHDSGSFRARTQVFSRMFPTFVAKLGSN